MRRFLFLALALAAAWAAAGATARADTGLRALDTGDQSRGWEAVGRLNLGDRGFCTAALIAPDVALTAAHCLYDKETGTRFPVAKLEFLADWRMGRAVAYRQVKRAVIPPEYNYAAADKLDRVGHDLALVQLDRPIQLPSIHPFAVGGPVHPGQTVGVVSYAQDRADAPSLQRACQVLGQRPGFFVLSCDIDFGSSGAPVFELDGGAARIVAVVSAKADAGGQQVALGVDLGSQIGALEARLRQIEAGTVMQAEGSRMPGALDPHETVLRTGGAKFLRP